MPSSYIPAKDSAFSPWLANLASLITAAPATYGLLAADAVTITAQNAAWAIAYALAISPATRTPESVQAKAIARVNALAIIRPYCQAIANNAGVSSDNKVALGLNPRTNGPTPITAPTTFPNLTIQSAGVLTHVMRYRDSAAAPSSKAKPNGATALQLYCSVSATPITDPATLKFVGPVTKSPFQNTFQSADAGKTAFYAARWVTRKGLVGPWSSVTPFIVAA